MNFNCYEILMLSFDPPETDPQKIKDKIEEMKKQWSNNINDARNGAKYRLFLENIKEIEVIMSDPEKQLEEAEKAQINFFSPIDRQLKLLHTKGFIRSEEAEKVASNNRVSLEVLKKRIEFHGYTLKEKIINYDSIYHDYFEQKPANELIYKSSTSDLSALSYMDYYDFLYPKKEYPSLHYIEVINFSSLDLRERANQIKKESTSHNQEASSKKKLSESCLLAFADETAKKEYDQYLMHQKRSQVLNDVQTLANTQNNKIDIGQLNAFIEKFTEIQGDSKLAKDITIALLEKKQISYPLEKNSEQKNQVVCRCGFNNDLSDRRTICTKCGKELHLRCPKCSQEVEVDRQFCKCGYDMSSLDKAEANCSLAKINIQELNFDRASQLIENAKLLWPKLERIRTVEDYYQKAKSLVYADMISLNKHISNKEFFKAQLFINSIKNKFSDFRNASLEESIQFTINSVNDYFQKALKSQILDEKLYFYSLIKELTIDYPNLKLLMADFPPLPPKNMKTFVDAISRQNIISWEKSQTEKVNYHITRKKNDIPKNPIDGDKQWIVTSTQLIDDDIHPCANYYYSIFSERGDVFSSPLCSERVTNLFEISNVLIKSKDSAIEIFWDPIPANATILIKKNDKNWEKVNNFPPFTDEKLTNEIEYRYHFCLEYIVNGKKTITPGVEVYAKPTKPPEGILNISITYDQNENFYLMNWTNPNNSDIQILFFYSLKNPEFKTGESYSIDDIKQKMYPLRMKNNHSSNGSFSLDIGDLFYIVPISLKHDTAVVGKISKVYRQGNVKIDSIREINGKHHILFSLIPKEVSKVIVLYRYDHVFPEHINDSNAHKIEVTFLDNVGHNRIEIKHLEKRMIHFSIFPEVEKDGEVIHLSGIQRVYDNSEKERIMYTLKRNGKIILFEFTSNRTSFYLPNIEIYSNIGGMPIFKESCKLLHTIPGQNVVNRLVVKFPIKPERNLFVKAMLKDQNLNSSHDLVMDSASNSKIG